ncbi:MAG: hypothetical protein ABIR57_03270 [Aeromicrobium sp.]
MTTNSSPPSARQDARKFVLVAVFVIGFEALAYVVFGLVTIASFAAGEAASTMGIGVFLAAYGVAQLYAGRMLVHWHSWARGPLVFTQLIQLGLAWGLRHSERPWLAVVMAVTALLALGCLLAPPVTRALIDDEVV